MSIGKTGLLAVLILTVTLMGAGYVLARTESDATDSVSSGQTIDSTSELSATDSTYAAGQTSDAEPLYPMSPERKAKLIAYSQFNHIWRFIEFFLTLAVLSLILFTGFSARLRNWAMVARRKFLILWLFIVLLFVADYIINFPFHLYRDFLVEGEYGFVNQTFGAWLGESLLGLLITVIFAIIPVWLIYFAIEKSKKWWLWVSAGMIPIAVFVIVISPVVISPLFNDYEPLKDKQLKAEILALADKAGIEGSDVFQVDASKQSSKINAYVTGLFATKRIVLYDTMIDNFTTDEIKFVMGHEMGHYVMNHVWIGLLIAVAFIGVAMWVVSRTIQPVINRLKHRFGFDSLNDIASLPLILLMLTVISFLFNPISNGFSRHMERQSDKYSMDISGVTGESAAIAFDKLSVLNLSDPDPHPFIEFWFYSHPALNKRMDFVRNYRP
ncbi:MAG: M48 family metallopeptidase [Candidatus Zixiibacteriota bacterium]